MIFGPFSNCRDDDIESLRLRVDTPDPADLAELAETDILRLVSTFSRHPLVSLMTLGCEDDVTDDSVDVFLFVAFLDRAQSKFLPAYY